MKDFIWAYNKGYRVNLDGEVVGISGRMRSLDFHKSGYKRFTVRRDNKCKGIFVHQLVAFQKYGVDMLQDNIEVRHLNGNCSDNRPSNISIGTASDNAMDKDRLLERV